MPENDAKPPLDLADIEDPPEAVEFEFETASLGTLACPRITAGHLMRFMRIAGDARSISPDQAARALLQAAVAKADGSKISDAEASALTPEEIEDFADRAVRADMGWQPEPHSPTEPATLVLLNSLRGLTEPYVGPLAQPTGPIMGNIGAFKDRLAATAVHAAGARLLAPGTSAAIARAMPAELARSVVPPPKPRPAEVTLRKIQERREAFAAGLPEDREVAVVIASAPGGACFYVAEMQEISAELISFRGLDDDGEAVEVVQHASQCNVMFLPIRKAAARGPLGFKPGAA